MSARWIAILIAAASLAFSQAPGPPQTVQNDAEQRDLSDALTNANASPVDLVRELEAFLKKYPQTSQRANIDRTLVKAAIDTKDDARTVLYGERVLALTPEDVQVLDRVAHSLLALGGRENAEKSLHYAQAFGKLIEGLPPAEGPDSARRVEDREHAMGRVLLYESRAKSILAQKEDAESLAAKSFSIYPTEEAAREWSYTLGQLGRNEEAVARLADAFAIPDPHATEGDRLEDRRRLGELYSKLHDGSQTGLGDLILSSYDRTAALLADRRNRIQKLDPNFSATDPMHFTLTGLDDKKLALESLKGNVVVLDFWATWCKPCRTQHPMYEAVKERFKDRSDVVFLSIDADEDHQLVAPFLDEQKWSRAVYFGDGLQRLLQVSAIPTTILFNKRGQVSSRMNGFVPELFVDQLTERIRGALAESNP